MDATNCYIFFQRLAAKIDLINTFVAHANNLPDALTGPVSEGLVGICEVRADSSVLYLTLTPTHVVAWPSVNIIDYMSTICRYPSPL